jgi:hypothetical protein
MLDRIMNFIFPGTARKIREFELRADEQRKARHLSNEGGRSFAEAYNRRVAN